MLLIKLMYEVETDNVALNYTICNQLINSLQKNSTQFPFNKQIETSGS